MTYKQSPYCGHKKARRGFGEWLLLAAGAALIAGAAYAGYSFLTAPEPQPAPQPPAVVQEQKPLFAQELYGSSKYLIYIHKGTYTLELYQQGQLKPIKSYPIAIAKNLGDKKKAGDNTTPISWGEDMPVHSKYPGAKMGVNSAQVPFRVEEICDASYWTHDFGDGKGEIAGAYGPWFISLDTGWNGIGIHGTHDPASIGTKASEGCIRMHNKDVEELKQLIYAENKGIGVGVIISEE